MLTSLCTCSWEHPFITRVAGALGRCCAFAVEDLRQAIEQVFIVSVQVDSAVSPRVHVLCMRMFNGSWVNLSRNGVYHGVSSVFCEIPDTKMDYCIICSVQC